MIEEIKAICTKVNAGYSVEYEESHMMNLNADQKTLDARFAYIEEFTGGNYQMTGFRLEKTVTVQLYFCRFIPLVDSTADARETIRKEIETEIVLPFIKEFKSSNGYPKNGFRYRTALPRFDANEVSIMLQFDAIDLISLC